MDFSLSFSRQAAVVYKAESCRAKVLEFRAGTSRQGMFGGAVRSVDKTAYQFYWSQDCEVSKT